jgi:hypothetical protein
VGARLSSGAACPHLDPPPEYQRRREERSSPNCGRTLSRRALRTLATIVCVVTFCFGSSRAADHFLVIGGGHSPENNQVSLEQNVLFFRDALATLKLNNSPQEVLFADGNDNQRDVQYTPDTGDAPKVEQLLDDVFPPPEAASERYRPHHIPNVWGPAQHAALERWFDTVGRSLPDGDRLIIYYTGHGGPGKPSQNTTLAMWNESSLSVRSFVALLDRLPPKVSVVLIMVQCFSGGFADVIYDKGDASRGLSPRNRCGFFATTFDRTAAGCTPDIMLDDYREYSTYFWAALCGHTRTGKAVEEPDFLGDGRIGMSEAHAYTMIHSETVDIPVKTSDTFLRQFSRLEANGAEGLVSPDMPYDRLCALARPCDRAVLNGLSEVLHLSGPDRVPTAQQMADTLQRNHDDLENRRQKVERAVQLSRRTTEQIVLNRWPMLSDRSTALAQRTIAMQEGEIEAMLDSSLSYERLRKHIDESDKLDDDADAAERSWVKCRRFINTAESVALAANLPSVAPKEIQERYHQLIVAEDAALAPAEHH